MMGPALSDGDTGRVAALLRERYGLHDDRLREAGLDAIVERAASAGAAGFSEGRLLEAVLIGETYLGRHAGQTAELMARHLPALARSRQSRPLRVLFAGCSTGEEVWSFLAAWSRSGLDWGRDSIDVLAVDVLEGSIERARRGRYGTWSLRGLDLPAERSWLELQGPHVQVRPELRARARFAVHNLMEPLEDAAGAEGFDLVVCRNVLIYLHEAGRRSVWSNLAAVTAPGGLILSTAVDPAPPPSLGLARRVEGRCVLHRRGPAPSRELPPSSPPPAPGPAHEEPDGPTPGPGAEPAWSSIELAHALLAGGRVAAARELLQAVEQEDPLDASAWVLRAQLELDADDADLDAAIDAARRAAFLAPDAPFVAWLLGAALLRAREPRAGVRLRGVRAMLEGLPDDAELAYSRGLVVAQLREVLRAVD